MAQHGWRSSMSGIKFTCEGAQSYGSYELFNNMICNILTLRGDTPAERAGLRLGDRLITVNDVFVVFLSSKEVLQVLNMNNTLVAWLEVER